MAGNQDNKKKRGPLQGFDLGGGSGPRGRWGISFAYILGALVLFLVVQSLLFQGPQTAPITALYEQIEQGEVREVTITSGSIEWVARDGERFRAVRPTEFQTQDLVKDLADRGVDVRAEQPSALVGFLVQWVLPLAILVAIWIFVMRRVAGGGAAGALNLGKNRVKIYDRKEMKTNFADVAGLDEAVEELREIVEFLRTPKKYQRLGGRIPKGVLLVGPPGCGKTLLARAVAGEAAVPFFYMSGSEFVEMFVGLGAARVRELFNQAKEKAPCLVFLDELDTIGKTRAGAMGGSFGSHDEREQTLNQLLVEMDGFDTSKGVIIMAATNRADVLDAALLRPGRFDRQVVVDWPDLRGRDAILKIHARGVALDPAVDLRILASRTPGFTGADLANVVNEAALLAARREKNAVTMFELEEAIDRVVAGLERKSRVLSEKEKERTAVHEMGHALAALRSKNADPVHRVSIIPRGAAALGITMVRPLEDRYTVTEPELKDQLVMAMGGRVAEELVFGEMSSGASDDLQRATRLARRMVLEFGMSPKLGPLAFGRDGFGSDGRMLFPGERTEMSEETYRIVDGEVSRIIKEAHDRARAILNDDRMLLDRLSRVLIAREVMEGKELEHYLTGEVPIPTDDELKLELEEKAASNGEGGEVPSGPSIIQSAPPAGTADGDSGRIPARPDLS